MGSVGKGYPSRVKMHFRVTPFVSENLGFCGAYDKDASIFTYIHVCIYI